MTTTRTIECDGCEGAGKRFDITCADKINAGPYAGQCSRCSGRGVIVKVGLGTYPSATELGALPDWDDTQTLPDWMFGE